MASELRYLLAGLNQDIAALNWTAAGRRQLDADGDGEIVRY
jgi:hypothetical protein